MDVVRHQDSVCRLQPGQQTYSVKLGEALHQELAQISRPSQYQHGFHDRGVVRQKLFRYAVEQLAASRQHSMHILSFCYCKQDRDADGLAATAVASRRDKREVSYACPTFTQASGHSLRLY